MGKEEKDDILNTEFTEKGFAKAVPDFSFSVSGTQITVRITPLPGADGYEVYRSKTARGEYLPVSCGMSPIREFYSQDKASYYYKVRAYHGDGNDRIITAFSKKKQIDLFTASRERDKKINSFFESLKEIGDVLSFEDLDVAIESLKVAGIELREKEIRRESEEEADEESEK